MASIKKFFKPRPNKPPDPPPKPAKSIAKSSIEILSLSEEAPGSSRDHCAEVDSVKTVTSGSDNDFPSTEEEYQSLSSDQDDNDWNDEEIDLDDEMSGARKVKGSKQAKKSRKRKRKSQYARSFGVYTSEIGKNFPWTSRSKKKITDPDHIRKGITSKNYFFCNICSKDLSMGYRGAGNITDHAGAVSFFFFCILNFRKLNS